MDTPSADYIHHRLARFSKAIDETRVHYRDLSAFGRYYAGAPYYEKYGIRLLLDENRLDPKTREELCREFNKLVQKLCEFEDELGQEYRAQLRQDLGRYTDACAAAVCHAHLGSIRPDDHDLFRRDLITALVEELEKDHDLTDLMQLLTVLDNNLFAQEEPKEPGTGASRQVTDSTRSGAGRSPIENVPE